MKQTLYILALIGLMVTNLSAQVESEAGFMYVKAKYLFDTDRHEDAIREFNKVIQIDPKHEDALLLRATSKYALAAYRGAELDIMEFIKIKGITPEAALLLGKTQYSLDMADAATTTLKSAATLAPGDPGPAELLAKMAEKEGELITACKYYQTAAKLGSSTASEKVRALCPNVGEIRPPNVPKEKPMSVGKRLEDKKKDLEEEVDETIDDNTTRPVVEDPDLNIDKPVEQAPIEDDNPEETERLRKEAEEAKQKEKEAMEAIDDTPRMLEIDQELTIKIQGQGLGTRAIDEQPNILILSESDGVVAIDVCVDKKGKVTEAAYNQEESTLSKKSLISLAIRKSKDFQFAKGKDNQCGTMSYMITGS